jgi:hypothetical protein
MYASTWRRHGDYCGGGGGANVHALGYAFIVIPVFINAIILLSIAMAIATFRDDNPFESRLKGEGDETLDVLEE